MTGDINMADRLESLKFIYEKLVKSQNCDSEDNYWNLINDGLLRLTKYTYPDQLNQSGKTISNPKAFNIMKKVSE